MTSDWKRGLSALAGVVALVATMGAQAATLTYDFTGTLDSGAYLGESFNGQVVFDDAALTGVADEWLGVSTVQVTFHGHTYSLADAAVAPEVGFLDGTFLGLAYTAEAAYPKFTTVTGTVDASDAFLAYDTAVVGASGAGTIAYTMAAVPDAPALLLLASGLVLLPLRRRAR